MDSEKIMQELTYRNYKYNRDCRPDIKPESFALVFGDVADLEKRYQSEKQLTCSHCGHRGKLE